MENRKTISKPKVRFCEFSDAREEIADHKKRHERGVSVQTKISNIKENVSVNNPRVVDSVTFASISDKDVSQGTSFYDKEQITAKGSTATIQRNVSEIQNTEKSCVMSQPNDSPQNNVLKNHTFRLQQKGKENKDMKRVMFKKNMNETKVEKSKHLQSVTSKNFKLSMSDNCMEKVNATKSTFKGSKMTKSQSAPNIKRIRNSMTQGRVFYTKPIALTRVKSHHNVVKNKVSPVKKIVLHNVSGPKIKTFVESKFFCKDQNDARMNDVNERHTLVPDMTLDLAQPDYNSITCTINKLERLKQQKIVTDISCLPPTIKNCLTGKISTALDFPLDEVIYKNLVDLNIDERQLPSAITRSKDPEPREKDIVPKLSDFFIPEDTKDICEAVYVKSRPSKISDNWNAFKISDKILEWKYSIDDIG
ncbi:hypothetical protein PUN28_007168 [Cardiocondyla obscurior]|uniref:Protein phosphatase 1 regulatory subunit 35 C-terminal domain-containing protein n=1 Tax=Cardiocondyla obscurior TaxID=286306 RepID=A0AAW2G723_9HYME